MKNPESSFSIDFPFPCSILTKDIKQQMAPSSLYGNYTAPKNINSRKK